MNAQEQPSWRKDKEPRHCESSANDFSYISLEVAVREFEARFGRRIRFKRNLAAVISKQFLLSSSREAAEQALRIALAANGLRLTPIAPHDLLVER